MKKNRITLTEDMLKVISIIKFNKIDIPSEMGGSYVLGIDSNSVYGGSDVLEDMSLAMGCYGEHITGTEDNFNGVQFDIEKENEMFDIHEFIMYNLYEIEMLLHYWSNKGGLIPGTYNTITMEREN